MIGWIVAGVVAVPTVSGLLFLRTEKFGALPQGDRLERILNSPHQKGGVFQNPEPTEVMTGNRGTLGLMADFLFGDHPGKIPRDSIPSVRTDLSALDRSKDLVVWFGHSSYLLQVGGMRFLVDPVFSGRATPMPFGTKAFPGSDLYKAVDMPPIDVLVITHDHWDHLDWETAKLLKDKVGKVACGLGVGAHLERWGYPAERIVELDWNDSLTVSDNVVLRAHPARHFSGRGLTRSRSLWCSFSVRSPTRNVYLGGDGGEGGHFAGIGKDHGPFDLAILEQGQYDSAWSAIHLLPQLVPRVMSDLGAKRLMPVHNSKFCISRHPWSEPLRLLRAGADSGGYGLLTPRIGEVAALDDTSFAEPWWTAVE